MKNENINVNPEALNAQELSLEDMEDVAGGVLKKSSRPPRWRPWP